MSQSFVGNTITDKRTFCTIFALLVNAIVWYFMTLLIITTLLNSLEVSNLQNILIWGAYHTAIIGSGIIGSFLSKGINRQRFIYLWIIFGVVTSALPALLTDFTAINVAFTSILLGASLGLGMPSCLAYFTDYSIVENRGIISGTILLVTNLIAALFSIVFGMFDLNTAIIVFVIWRASVLVTVFLKSKQNCVSERKKEVRFVSVIRDRTFTLFFVAWLMFCLIDRFETPIQKNLLGDLYPSMQVLGTIISSISAFVGGLFADRIGRKKTVLYGFVSLGAAYAVIGITAAPTIAWYLSITVLSVSTGILWVLFIFVIWGDITRYVTSEKYYALGIAPFFITHILQLLSAEYVTEIEVTSAFSLAAFFLFLAVLPLWYAPETLPEKKMELRRLRSFAEDAKKAKEKYEQKMKK